MSDCISTEVEEVEECHSCEYSDIPLKTYGRNTSIEREARLCDICASTHTGNATIWPGRFGESIVVMKTLAYYTNRILDQMGAFNEFRKTKHARQ